VPPVAGNPPGARNSLPDSVHSPRPAANSVTDFAGKPAVTAKAPAVFVHSLRISARSPPPAAHSPADFVSSPRSSAQAFLAGANSPAVSVRKPPFLGGSFRTAVL
jgi:hypothetical protein